MSLRYFFQIIKARYWLIIFLLLITVVTTVTITNLLPKQYIATTSLVLNATSSNPFEAQGTAPLKISSTYITTQLDIIRSMNVAHKVVEALHMYDDPALKEQYQAEVGGKGTIQDWLAANVQKNLIVEPSTDSGVIGISYKSTNPQRAADIANAFAQSYIAATLELMTEPARRNTAWFDDQLKVLRKRLSDAQARLTGFQQEKGIISIDERLDTETNRLNELSKAYVAVQAETDDIKSRQLGENHPEYKRAISRERALRASLDEQKTLILELKKQRDQLNVLAHDVENEQRNYEATLQRYYQTSMESQFNQPSIAILNPAVPPQDAASPNVFFNVVSSVFLGLLLGIILSIVVEMLDRHIRTVEDISDALGVRVLARL